MKRLFLHFYILMVFGAVSSYAQSTENFFQRADIFLGKYVDNGKVDYYSIANNPSQLDSLAELIASYDVDNTDSLTRKAFYINAYNLLVIKNVVDHYPISSPMDIDGFFDDIEFIVSGESITLDKLEFSRLFGSFADPRLHFVLNCAAKSCPTLFKQAFRPTKLEEQLNFSAKMVTDREDYVSVDKKKRVIYVSKIFDWYREMFETGDTSLRQYINGNRFTSLPEQYPIQFMEYDWSLNIRN